MSANGASPAVEIIKPKRRPPAAHKATSPPTKKTPAAPKKSPISVAARLAKAEKTVEELTWFTAELMVAVRKMVRERLIDVVSPQLQAQAQQQAEAQKAALREQIDAELAQGFGKL